MSLFPPIPQASYARYRAQEFGRAARRRLGELPEVLRPRFDQPLALSGLPPALAGLDVSAPARAPAPPVSPVGPEGPEGPAPALPDLEAPIVPDGALFRPPEDAGEAAGPAEGGSGDWASGARSLLGRLGGGIGGLREQLPGGRAWESDLERIRGEREQAESAFPTPAPAFPRTPPPADFGPSAGLRPSAPLEFAPPETGTPEGQRISSALAETAAREVPGLGWQQQLLRRYGAAGAPLEGEAAAPPLERAAGLAALATAPFGGYLGDVAAAQAEQATAGAPAPISVGVPLVAGMLGPDVGDVARGARALVGPTERALARQARAAGRAAAVVPEAAKPPGFSDWARSLAYGVRLSNPAGILADAMSGPVEVSWKLARDALTQRPSATVAEAAGIKAGMARALPVWWQTLRQALPEAADVPGGPLVERLKAGGVAPGQSEVGRSLVERLRAAEVPESAAALRAGTAIEFPSRLRRAGDQANWNTAFQQDLHRQAALHATRQGQRPLSREWWQAVQDFVEDAPDAARETATAQADLVTFRNDPGTMGRALSGLANDKYLGVLFPFVRTGYNVATRGLERTPGAGLVGIAADVAKGSGSLGERIGAVPRLRGRLADQALGSMVFGTAALLAEQGLVSGDGPDNPAQLAELRAHGWRPNSVWLPEPGTPGGGAFYDYSRLGPLAFPLALAGAYGDSVRFREAGEGRQDVLDEAAANFGRWGRDQTILRGASELYEATGDPIDAGARLASSTIGPYLGIGGALAAAGSAVDPYQRDPAAAAREGYPGGRLAAEAASRVPGVRQTLPARRDPFGRPVPNEGFGAGLVLPYRRAVTPEQRGERAAPFRYQGSHSVEEDARIAAAIRHVEDFEAGRTRQRPGAEARRLARRFAGRENPRYEAQRAAARRTAQR